MTANGVEPAGVRAAVTGSTGLLASVRRTAVTGGMLGFLAVPRLRREPFGLYRLLQRIDRAHHSLIGLVVLSGHGEVSAALRHPAMGSDESRADMDTITLGPLDRFLNGSEETRVARREGAFRSVTEHLMLFLDPPDHTRLRRLVAKAFTARVAERLEPRIQAVVDDLLDRAATRGRMEVMSELAYPLPAKIICELIGVGADDEHVITEVAPAVAIGLDPSPLRTAESNAAADRAAELLIELLDRLIVERRANPTDDLLSALVAVEEDGDRLTREELISTIGLLLIAGHETTANLIGNGLIALQRQPGALARWRDDPAVDRTAVDELLRHSGPVQMSERIALEDVDLGDVHIPRGRIVVLCNAAANRDPLVFTNPGRLDLARDPNPHVSFGSGPHHCIGAALARSEARIALTTMLRRFPNLRVDVRRPEWRPSFTLRGVRSLDVALR